MHGFQWVVHARRRDGSSWVDKVHSGHFSPFFQTPFLFLYTKRISVMPTTTALSVPVTTAFTGAAAMMYAGLQLRVGLYRFDKGVLFGTKGTDGTDATLTAISRAGE